MLYVLLVLTFDFSAPVSAIQAHESFATHMAVLRHWAAIRVE
jgi:hypothetical protein